MSNNFCLVNRFPSMMRKFEFKKQHHQQQEPQPALLFRFDLSEGKKSDIK